MREVAGQRVLVVGLGRSGRAVARCLRRRNAILTVSDERPPWAFQSDLPELLAQGIGLELGGHREETFLAQDFIVVSPGVPPEIPSLQAARQRNIPVLPEIEVASWFLKGLLVGITGSNGKTTTTALVGKVLQASGLAILVGGNIGVPLISAVDHDSPETLLVTELSSFQLEMTEKFRPHVAALLNLTPNHLDRHPSMEAYVAAKAKIFQNQTAADVAVLNADDPEVMRLAPSIRSRKVFFSRNLDLPDGVLVSEGEVLYRVGNLERVLFATREIALRGEFNLENVLAAAAIAAAVGADLEALRQAVREFQGVEHRLEFVREVRGVEFFNDSKATSVDATAKALSAFDQGVHLILGGKDKGAPYAPLRPLVEKRVRAAYLIGAAAERIASELAGAAQIVRAGDLETAVREAFRRAARREAVLLSPACASFDQFPDFEHRGRVFKELVERLALEEAAARAAPEESQLVSNLEALRSVEPAAQPTIGTWSSGEPAQDTESRAAPPGPQVQEPERELPPPAPPISAPERGVSQPEPIYVYEVSAEELAPADWDVPVALSIDDVELAQELRALEPIRDEALPFELRASAGDSAAQGPQDFGLKLAEHSSDRGDPP